MQPCIMPEIKGILAIDRSTSKTQDVTLLRILSPTETSSHTAPSACFADHPLPFHRITTCRPTRKISPARRDHGNAVMLVQVLIGGVDVWIVPAGTGEARTLVVRHQDGGSMLIAEAILCNGGFAGIHHAVRYEAQSA